MEEVEGGCWGWEGCCLEHGLEMCLYVYSSIDI